MNKLISKKEMDFIESIPLPGIMGVILLIVGTVDWIFGLVTANYIILSIATSFLTALASIGYFSIRLAGGLTAMVILAYLLAYMLKKKVYKKYPNSIGLFTAVAGVVLVVAFYFLVWPSLVLILPL